MKKAILGISFVVAIIASLLVGQYIGERNAMAAAAIEMDGVQADLVFNRIVVEKKMLFMLAKGCIFETQDALSISEDQDMKLLAEFFKGKLSGNARKYIYDRDPELRKTLGTFKSKYGDSWIEPSCKK